MAAGALLHQDSSILWHFSPLPGSFHHFYCDAPGSWGRRGNIDIPFKNEDTLLTHSQFFDQICVFALPVIPSPRLRALGVCEYKYKYTEGSLTCSFRGTTVVCYIVGFIPSYNCRFLIRFTTSGMYFFLWSGHQIQSQSSWLSPNSHGTIASVGISCLTNWYCSICSLWLMRLLLSFFSQ